MIFAGLGCVAASALLLKMAKKEKAAMDQAGRLTLNRIRYLKAGLCLTSGEVVCETPLETPYSRTAAVLYRYAATEFRSRNKTTGSGRSDQMLSSGSRACRFILKDDSGEIEIDPQGADVAGYAHSRLLKSMSGRRTPVGERIRKLKEIDRKGYPDGKKKPFFRKLDMEDQPLDIPDDLVEIQPESSEAGQALRKYSEKWIQNGDEIFVLGELVSDTAGRRIISSKGKNTPFFISSKMEDVTSSAFQKNYLKSMLFGLLFGIGGVLFFLSSLGIFNQ